MNKDKKIKRIIRDRLLTPEEGYKLQVEREQIEKESTPVEISYEEWRALGPEKATEYIAERLFLTPDTKRKLKAILKKELNKNESKTSGTKG